MAPEENKQAMTAGEEWKTNITNELTIALNMVDIVAQYENERS